MASRRVRRVTVPPPLAALAALGVIGLGACLSSVPLPWLAALAIWLTLVAVVATAGRRASPRAPASGPWLRGAGCLALGAALAALTWLPGWHLRWQGPAAAGLTPALVGSPGMATLAREAWAAERTHNAGAAVPYAAALAQADPTAARFERLGQDQLRAGQVGGPPQALDQALALGADSAALWADLGTWYVANGLGDAGVANLLAWRDFQRAAAVARRRGAYAARIAAARATATQALRLGTWARAGTS